MALEEEERRIKENKISFIFPETGTFARDKYPKQMEFFRSGAQFKERAFIAGNRTGKTTAGAAEMVYHLSGQYPDWWVGARFEHPILAVAAGKTNQTTRDIIQKALLGESLEKGTGLIPKHLLDKGRITARAGVPDAVNDIYIPHKSGGFSHLILKSYEQGRGSFEGLALHVVWFDEEPEPKDEEIYSEALVRTATTKGIVYCTFTPMEGLTNIYMSFMPDGMLPEQGIVNKFKKTVMASWDDVPLAQIPQDARDQMIASTLPHMIEARRRGIATIGEGKIYPLSEEDIVVDSFAIPAHWSRVFALDPGYTRTACVWGAIDPNTNICYIYLEYYRGQAEPSAHISAIKSVGQIPGVIDYAGAKSGTKTIDIYRDDGNGLDIYPANKEVDAGILKVYKALSEGTLKIFKTCTNWLKEYRVYRYDKFGKPVKLNDHLMDATRYLMMSGLQRAEVVRPDRFFQPINTDKVNDYDKDSITGY